jgi:hypothetical protein
MAHSQDPEKISKDLFGVLAVEIVQKRLIVGPNPGWIVQNRPFYIHECRFHLLFGLENP